MKTYSAKEIFYTLQGEGANAGRAAVFCRFSGCNLWSGLEKDRASAVCQFCDTDFVGVDGLGGGKFKSAEAMAEAIDGYWPQTSSGTKLVVCTGGEPLLQLDKNLIECLHEKGFEIAVETNGTIKAPEGIDWLCVSPKANSEIVQTSGHELKLVFPQEENTPEDFLDFKFDHFFLQPKDDLNQAHNIQATIDYIHRHPQWRLSLQTHKITGIR
ncbi:7-carboxy-7-deazaguanine synthase [Temperatibacter marinus]|uniref:7-carboxy-7-deazaguanine synthase n=1 Tax=Temperatibacter marinus TaxID=1456591 RepID=A0AA52EG97_9PROT|nr:7-carboxy-7-deazaguanine synthase [Temperatibacter marinus]WND02583.1 7-carboxy-7-deazaguanine synthase [Temperatibacter marinus]